MLRLVQSSDVGPEMYIFLASLEIKSSVNPWGYCGHEGLNLVALIRMLLCAFPFGGENRRDPAGGSAKRIPRNYFTLGNQLFVKQLTVPTDLWAYNGLS